MESQVIYALIVLRRESSTFMRKLSNNKCVEALFIPLLVEYGYVYYEPNVPLSAPRRETKPFPRLPGPPNASNTSNTAIKTVPNHS
jgi:hypothetical protein